MREDYMGMIFPFSLLSPRNFRDLERLEVKSGGS